MAAGSRASASRRFYRAARGVYNALPLGSDWRWPLKRAFFETVGRAYRGTDLYQGYYQERRWRESLAVARERSVAARPLGALPAVDRPCVVIWGMVDWHFRVQRPQHLARAFCAAGHRVLYVSPLFESSKKPGFRAERIVDDGSLVNVHLHLAGRPSVHEAPPDPAKVAQLRESVSLLLRYSGASEFLSLVQHPFWAELAAHLPNSQLVYDWIDDHAAFETHTGDFAESQQRLLRTADLVTCTALRLEERAARSGAETLRVPNAADFDFLSVAPRECFSDPAGRPVVGYIGAVAEWFDLELLDALVDARPDLLFLIVGGDSCRAEKRLRPRDNLRFEGEVEYARVPYYLHGFDVALLPFRRTPLTLATNPVKVFEYLAAGKPVVASDLPEMVGFGDLARVAVGPEAFAEAIEQALQQGDQALRARAVDFARRNNWEARRDAVLTGLTGVRRRVSVVVVSYGNWSLSDRCLASLRRHRGAAPLEIIVVDNASPDESPERLARWAAEEAPGEVRRVIQNESNRGFAAACNQGMARATGDPVILLNNDTEVSEGWLSGLARHLRADPQLGLLGPVTDNVGNEARVVTAFETCEEMEREAFEISLANRGRLRDMKTLGFFCVAIPRRVFESVGLLDERFGLGYFEDDDYCRRVEAAGYRIACAEDVFVHHLLGASFSQLAASEKQDLMERNRRLYEEKWGSWTPHEYR